MRFAVIKLTSLCDPADVARVPRLSDELEAARLPEVSRIGEGGAEYLFAPLKPTGDLIKLPDAYMRVYQIPLLFLGGAVSVLGTISHRVTLPESAAIVTEAGEMVAEFAPPEMSPSNWVVKLWPIPGWAVPFVSATTFLPEGKLQFGRHAITPVPGGPVISETISRVPGKMSVLEVAGDKEWGRYLPAAQRSQQLAGF